MLLASQAWAEEHDRPVWACLVDAETGASDYVDGEGGLLMAPALDAVPRLLERNDLTLESFTLVEVHEAFASVVLCPRDPRSQGPGPPLRRARRGPLATPTFFSPTLLASLMSSARIELRSARPEETEAIASLVNDAYGRTPTESGWTSEDDILEGPRVQAADLEAMIDEDDARLLVAESDDGEELVGCVHLQRIDGGAVELGLFCVRPHRQNGGLGQQMLAAAEEAAIREFGAERIVLKVITERTELLDWYDRRGYERTGETKTFEPEAPQRSLVGELAFEVLEKRVA